MNDFNVICYTGGTCGDLVTAVIDTKGCSLANNKSAVCIDRKRSAFKKPHLFVNDIEKKQRINKMKLKYRSIPSHDSEYHLLSNDSIIGIVTCDKDVAFWASNRFKDLHSNSVWTEMTNYCNAFDITEYSQVIIDFSKMLQTNNSNNLYLEDILSGNLLKRLNEMNIVTCENGEEFYFNWLSKQRL